jgi:creatinine amidohydrolase
MKEVRLEYLRPGQILAAQAERSLVFLPVGSIEWHGPHLPLGVDMLLAHEIAVRAAQRVGGVVHPAVYSGTERERPREMLRSIGFGGGEWVVGMDHPANSVASYYYPEETFGLIVREAIAQLVRHGYRLIMVANAHGAGNQIATLQRLASAFTAEGPATVRLAIPLPMDTDELGHLATEAGHADAYETGAMLHLLPDTVDLATLPASAQPLRNLDFAIVDGPTFSGHPTPDFTVRPTSDPRQARAEVGRASLDDMTARLVAATEAALREIE